MSADYDADEVFRRDRIEVAVKQAEAAIQNVFKLAKVEDVKAAAICQHCKLSIMEAL